MGWFLVATALAAAPCEGWAAPRRAGVLGDATLEEVSGAVVGRGGVLWVVEDSGNEPMVVGVLPARRAETVARVVLDGVRNVDFEDLAIGPCPEGRCFFVADIGDNRQIREEVRILRFAEPAPDVRIAHVTPITVRFRYPMGPQNAEALVVTPDGRMIVLTKRDDGRAEVFVVPAEGGEARSLGFLPVHGRDTNEPRATVTGASATPDGAWLLVRTYAAMFGFASAGGTYAIASRQRVPAAREVQGEAVAWDPDRRGYWHVSEGVGAALWFVSCR